MKAPDFDYQRPATLEQALQLISDPALDFALLAGGQSLMPMMHLRLAQPEVLIDLNALGELDFIRSHNDAIEIGAMTRYSTLQSSKQVAKHIPLLANAIPHIAHSAIRNRGTIGGSIALADPAAEVPAVLKALDATLVVQSSNVEREIAADDFFTGLYETRLAENELVKSVRFKHQPENGCQGFYEITRRHGDYAMAGVAIAAASRDPLKDVRVVFFGVAEQALRAHDCEQALEGNSAADDIAVRTARETLAQLPCLADLHGSVQTKRKLSAVAFDRALQEINT